MIALFVVTCGSIFSNFVAWIVSKSQLEELLEEIEASRLTRFFCSPFLNNEDATSISCSMFMAFMFGCYFSFGFFVLSKLFSFIVVACILILPLVLIIATINIFSRRQTERLLVGICRPTWFLIIPFRPFSALMIAIENKISSILGSVEEESEEDREEIIAAVTDGEHDGVVEGAEREMIKNIFDLKNFDISDIMTPRTDICAIDINESFDSAVTLASEKGFSRIPVYIDNRDKIKGIFYVKDALTYFGKQNKNTPSLKDIVREPFFVPETKGVGELMSEFQQQKNHLAIVLDEYGGTAGLVTIEDVVEEIVGEIQDEYDEEEISLIEVLSKDVFSVDARFHVHDMNEALGEKIIPEDDDFETVGGFVLDKLGHMPIVGESFVSDGFSFLVISADERKIEKVEVKKDSPEA